MMNQNHNKWSQMTGTMEDVEQATKDEKELENEKDRKRHEVDHPTQPNTGQQNTPRR